jgi:hypothetical protein
MLARFVISLLSDADPVLRAAALSVIPRSNQDRALIVIAAQEDCSSPEISRAMNSGEPGLISVIARNISAREGGNYSCFTWVLQDHPVGLDVRIEAIALSGLMGANIEDAQQRQQMLAAIIPSLTAPDARLRAVSWRAVPHIALDPNPILLPPLAL